jgi:nitroreductase
MNQVIETIMNRRSVRKYEPKPVPEDVLQTIIEAGNAAPSGCNAQYWRFVVVRDREYKNKLLSLAIPRLKTWLEKAPEEFAGSFGAVEDMVGDPIYYDAPAIVFVIGWGMTADLDTPMVCENMMLAARSMGLGSCWVFFGQLPTDDPEVRSRLDLKEGEKVYGPILLGYPYGGFPNGPAKKPPVIDYI